VEGTYHTECDGDGEEDEGGDDKEEGNSAGGNQCEKAEEVSIPLGQGGTLGLGSLSRVVGVCDSCMTRG